MIYAFYGFLFGFCIPYMARRFAKFMPATPAYAVYRLLKPVKTVSKPKKQGNLQYQKLMRKYIMRSIGWAIICSSLSWLCYFGFEGASVLTRWYIGCLWTLLLLAEIDKRMELLPDILTFPLLLAGFLCASFSSIGGFVNPMESSIGAAIGFALPIFASAFLIWKDENALGGGDIKLFSALGAWLGTELLLYTVIASCLIFAIEAIITRKRCGAFGPSIVWATILIAFLRVSGIL